MPPQLVVAFAATASDLPSLQAVLSALSTETGIAALIVTDDSVDGVKLLDLLRKASRWRIETTPGKIAPDSESIMVLGSPERGDKNIDDILIKTADDHHECAAAVVFSGAAGKCIRGLRIMQESGGLVVIEEQTGTTTASYALAKSLADTCHPASAISEALISYARRQGEHEHDDRASPEARAHLENILELIHAQIGVDFSEYKHNTLLRRIDRRMGLLQIADIAEYIKLLQSDPREVHALFHELLIGVTRFFRDPEAQDVFVAKAIPELLARNHNGDPIRIWVAGCSTGEEAYSIAILLREAIESRNLTIPVKIFATDLDRAAIEIASRGLYPASAVADVSADRLSRWFNRRDGDYQISKQIREMVSFAPHNLLKDPPFYKLDLISCRNMLIYLQTNLQRKVLTIFHFALNNDGLLLLGSSETLGEMSSNFEVVDARWKLYRKKPGRRMSLPMSELWPGRSSVEMAAPAQRSSQPSHREQLQNQIKAALLHELMPASVVVSESFEILHISGKIDRFLKIPPGKPSFNVLQMAQPDISLALSTGVRKAFSEMTTVVFDSIVTRDGQSVPLNVRLTIKPLVRTQDVGNLVLVVFEESVSGKPAEPQPFDRESQSNVRIRELELEIEHSNENLQAAIEELETSNEELQATNEELLAANEELQSTNEELQSVNEELYTVNAEYHAKIAELTDANNDIVNLLASTNIGTIFLDSRLCIRKFTPAIAQQINIIDKDVGRPLEHLSHNILYSNLIDDCREVLQTLVPKQAEVQAKNGRWHLMRIMPYRTEDNVIKGVVLTFIDISQSKARPAT